MILAGGRREKGRKKGESDEVLGRIEKDIVSKGAGTLLEEEQSEVGRKIR